MHPSAPGLSNYAVDGHPSPIPAPGIPNHGPREIYPSLSMSSMHPHAVPVKWSTGLCHCCDDPANCLITCCCPCITFGQIAEIVNKGSQYNRGLIDFLILMVLVAGCAIACAVSGTLYALVGSCCLACLYSCFFRSKMRAQYDLEEAPCVDCLVHFCCPFCALCQEYRELKNRGFDMGIGWEANMDRQSRGITVAPTMGQGMTR